MRSSSYRAQSPSNDKKYPRLSYLLTNAIQGLPRRNPKENFPFHSNVHDSTCFECFPAGLGLLFSGALPIAVIDNDRQG
jgi:hypothetical protein